MADQDAGSAPKGDRQTLAKTASSPTALNLVTKRNPPTALAPMRLSQLSDSGAESCGDGDEQTRLIRGPSVRAPKYIIIPATPGTPVSSTAGAPHLPFRQTNSTTSLVAMSAAMHKQPLRQASVKSRPSSDVIQPAQLQQQMQLQQQQQQQPTTSTSTVTFTIDDYDTAAAPAAGAPPIPVVQYTPATLTSTTTTTMAGLDGLAVTAQPLSYDVRSRLGSHHSSMRSVVSAYLPGLSDSSCNLASSSAATGGLQPPNPLYMQPQSSLSGSSYHFHELAGNQIYSDVTSVRSLASIGIGSTDGRKLVIRRVPTTANELFDMVNPQTPP
ncbi:hypothetical protein AWZ03_007585 [Drosophila navojoa]|uniref:Uncharacterized protein n=2 Tax=Drosophila navojoa TaxID=7232 RepID=A0A484BDX7_DRONA|nr:hypothetical protein AWZ03_007585 [Drosophila navojoa]